MNDMNAALAIDLTRLFLGPLSTTPRGIDRVELAYAQHLLNAWSGPCFMTLPTPWGIRCFDRTHALRMVEAVVENWREEIDADEDPVFRTFLDTLATGARPQVNPRSPVGAQLRSTMRGYAHVFHEAGLAVGRSAIRTLPENCLLLNVGQIGLASRRILKWLRKRSDIIPLFMLHDTIPIDHPEFVTVQSQKFHHKMVANTAQYAAGMIATTKAAAASVHRQVEILGRKNLSTVCAHLPLHPIFYSTTLPDPRLSRRPFFVMCGSFEPRKNHTLILNVWRHLINLYGDATPLLVLVGNRTRPNSQDLALLERCDPLRRHVVELTNLSTPALKKLLTSAGALLMPSFAEGFGLPIAEAMASGTPAIASDIPSHREVGDGYATLLSPIDGRGWFKSIQEHMCEDVNLKIRMRLRSYRPMTSVQYFDQIEAFAREQWRGRRNARFTSTELVENFWSASVPACEKP